jgi:hypothetical protein
VSLGWSGKLPPEKEFTPTVARFPRRAYNSFRPFEEVRMIARRRFLGVAAVAPSLVASRSGFSALAAAASLGSLKARKVGKVEIVFKSPNGSQPNGLQATAEGLWIMDQAAGNKAYLVSYDDGRVLRSFETETDRSSGLTFENGTLWIGSTYSREIVHCDATTGKKIGRAHV